jgi:1,4-alpha-glucan branching enzyme
VINSDADMYAGSNYGNGGEVFTQEEPRHGQAVSLSLNLPPLGVLILRPEPL